MNRIESFFRKIPNDGLLIIGHKGEFWCDRARFSTSEPTIIPPSYQLSELQDDLKHYNGKLFQGIFIAWGLSQLLQTRQVLEKALSLLNADGYFWAVEVSESEMSPATLNHHRFIRHLYARELLPTTRMLNLLKSLGLAQARCHEVFSFSGFWNDKDTINLRNYASQILSQDNTTSAKWLLKSIQKEGIEPSPVLLFEARKRGSLSARASSASQAKKSSGMATKESLYRRLIEFGTEEMEDEELISLVLDCDLDLSQKVLAQYGGKSLLKEQDLDKLSSLLGMDDVKVANLLALLEIGRRMFEPHPELLPEIHSPQEAYQYLSDMKILKREHLRGLYLNVRGKIIRDEVVAIGTHSRALISPREVITPALEHNAVGIILAHNHISGIAEPSSEDIDLTARIEKAAELMKIDLWDHIIITPEGYYSFNEAGRLKGKPGGSGFPA